MPKIFLRSGFPFNYDTSAASDESGLSCAADGVGRTIQSGKEEADINTIVRRFGLTGELPRGVRMPTYLDFEGVFDYQSALNSIRAAEMSFEAMPADVRSRFHNDPAEFVDFCSDDANRAEAERLGLVPAKPTPQASGAPEDAPKAPSAPSPGGSPG